MSKKLTILSFAKFHALLYALIGLFAGILYSVGGFAIDTLVSLNLITSTETPGLSYGTLLAFGALIGMPAIGAVVGFFVGILAGVLYNLCVKRFSGVGINFKIFK